MSSDIYRVVVDAAEIEQIALAQDSLLAQIYFKKRPTGIESAKWLHFLRLYERYLSRYRGQPFRLLEIGIHLGGSFPMWRDYFGPEATIFGIDIVADYCEALNRQDIDCHARQGSQADADFLTSVVAEMGGIEVVIDDGSHIAEHQLASFRALFPLLSNGGVYICEDTHTSYWAGWNGGYKRDGTFHETVKDMIDSLHTWYYPIANDLGDMNLHRCIEGLHVHDSFVAIEKAEMRPPLMICK